MAQAKQIAQFNSFVAGLITEATELTYPKNSSLDEDNCVLNIKGNRTRRKGVEFEDNYQLSSFNVSDTNLESFAINTFTWLSANSTDINLLVVQLGSTLYFYDFGYTPLSSGLKSFTVNLDSYLSPAGISSSTHRCNFTVARGDLFVVNENIEPLHIVYNSNTDTITVEKLTIQIRDFAGVNDGLAADARTSAYNANHYYNLLNQGWILHLAGMTLSMLMLMEAAVCTQLIICNGIHVRVLLMGR